MLVEFPDICNYQVQRVVAPCRFVDNITQLLFVTNAGNVSFVEVSINNYSTVRILPSQLCRIVWISGQVNRLHWQTWEGCTS